MDCTIEILTDVCGGDREHPRSQQEVKARIWADTYTIIAKWFSRKSSSRPFGSPDHKDLELSWAFSVRNYGGCYENFGLRIFGPASQRVCSRC